VRQGDHYVVNGQKTWTTLAQYADWIFCLCRTDPTAAKKQLGISFLLIDMKTPGITVRPLIMIDGRHEVNEVFLNDVRVPVENLVGKENEGWTCAKFLLSYERTGIARAGLTKVILRQIRHAIEQAPGARPEIEHALCRLEVELKALELTQLRILGRAGADDSAVDPMSSILKLMGSDVRQRASELLLELQGERALVASREAEQTLSPDDEADLRAAETYFGLRAASIYGGASEIQKNIIAQSVLNLK
jgi:alkylation response protein AidB-like acyl-CoA dehydrogenase